MSSYAPLNYSFLNKNIHLFLSNPKHVSPQQINSPKTQQIVNKCTYYAVLRSKIPQDHNGRAYLGAFILSSAGNVYSTGYNKLRYRFGY
jgi:hypothetical protein